MLVIKLELWPYGDESAARELGRMHISNDGTGDGETGHYVEMSGAGATTYRRRVTDWPRRRGAWALVREVLRGVWLSEDGR